MRALAVTVAVALGATGIGPAAVSPAQAQNKALRGLPIVRDTEIEQLLRD
jgi:hypothetical protein